MYRQSEFDSLLTPVIYHHFNIGMDRVPQFRNRLFNVQQSALAEEKGTGLGGFSADAWDVYNQSGHKGRLKRDQQYTQTYTHQEYPVELVIEKKLLINDQDGQLQREVQMAGLSAAQKMENDAATLLSLAFSGKTWADGTELCATDHPIGPNDSSTTQSNEGTAPLTAQALSDTRVDMMKFEDDKGNILGIVADELWVPPELEDTALKLVRSVLDPESAENAVNPQSGRYAVNAWPRLTDTNAWFLAAGAWRQMTTHWYEREPMQVMLTHETTTELVYELKLHYSYGTDDWRWIFGHNPS